MTDRERPRTSRPYARLSLFLVEDEALIRMMIADMVEELGHRVIAQAGNVHEALHLAETVEFDFALLDVNLDGESIVPVAIAIERRGLPFLFVTGCASSGLPKALSGKPVLRKPFPIASPRQAIDNRLNRPVWPTRASSQRLAVAKKEATAGAPLPFGPMVVRSSK
jgi:CheY-like chemotaxis protein